MTPKEMLKIIERRKVGLAYKIWKTGMLSQMLKEYPNFEDAMKELLPPKVGVEMPDFLKEKYNKQQIEKMKGG